MSFFPSLNGLFRPIARPIIEHPKVSKIALGAVVLTAALAASVFFMSKGSSSLPQKQMKPVRGVSTERNILPAHLFPKDPVQSELRDVYNLAQHIVRLIISKNIDFQSIERELVLKGFNINEARSIVAQALSLARRSSSLPLSTTLNNGKSAFEVLTDELRSLETERPRNQLVQVLRPLDFQEKTGSIPAEFRENLLQYLQGKKLARVLNINEDNYAEKLRYIKIFDLEYKALPRKEKEALNLIHSTYELRTRCLVASKGKMHSFEAYTYSTDKRYFENPFSAISRDYASVESHYIPERVALHAVVTQNYVIDMYALSRRFGHQMKPKIYALSGNTAVGKSYMSRKDPNFKEILDEHGEARGAINPDTVKALLRKEVDAVTNQQIHIEGAALGVKIAEEIKEKALRTSIVIDERLGLTRTINPLIEMARQSGKELIIKDIDAPLELSVLRVLGRDVKFDPCVPYGPIAGGYKAIREEREKVIKLVLEAPEVVSYELYVTDELGKSGLAARKAFDEKGRAYIEILDQDLYDYSLSGLEKAAKDIQVLKTKRITPDLWGRYKGMGVNTVNLRKYEDQIIEEALLKHSLKLPVWG